MYILLIKRSSKFTYVFGFTLNLNIVFYPFVYKAKIQFKNFCSQNIVGKIINYLWKFYL